MYGIIHGHLQRGITVRVQSTLGYAAEPCGIIPTLGLAQFWTALDKHRTSGSSLYEQWERKTLVSASPDFPVLSSLVEMEIDLSRVEAGDIPRLMHELEIANIGCQDDWGNLVFGVLLNCASLARDQFTGLLLSPFE